MTVEDYEGNVTGDKLVVSNQIDPGVAKEVRVASGHNFWRVSLLQITFCWYSQKVGDQIGYAVSGLSFSYLINGFWKHRHWIKISVECYKLVR